MTSAEFKKSEATVDFKDKQEISETFDLKILHDLVNLSPDRADYDELIQVFVKNSLERFELIRVVAERRDFSELKNLFHAMKGSCAAFGVRRLAQWCQEIENSCEALSPEALNVEVADFGEDLKKVQQFLREFRGAC